LFYIILYCIYIIYTLFKHTIILVINIYHYHWWLTK